jgi:hypothetical protein
MFNIRSSSITAGLAVLLSPVLTHANNGHFMVDHAVIADPGSCQIETWVHRDDTRSINTLALAPACSVVGGWQFGVPLYYNMDDSRFSGADFQAKRIIASGNNFGDIAMTLGTHYNNNTERLERTYVNLPWSAEVTSNMTMHLNAGLSHVRATSNLKTNWGLAAAYHYSEVVDFILEGAAFGSSSPSIAAGVRFHLASGFELDASIGRDDERRSDFGSIGVNFRF